MKFNIFHFHKTLLYTAVISDNAEIVQLLLDNEKTDVNLNSIFFLIFISFQIFLFLLHFNFLIE